VSLRPSLPELTELVADLKRRVRILEANPVAGAGIDFNKTNQFDASGADAEYLYIKVNGTVPVVIDGVDYAYYLINTGTPGALLTVQDGDGLVGFVQDGNGSPGTEFTPGTDWGAKEDASGDEIIGFGIVSNSPNHGSTVIRSTTGQTEIFNDDLGILLASDGTDINNISVKVDVGGWSFLVQNGQVVTRNGSHIVTAIVSDQLFRVDADGSIHGKASVGAITWDLT
jgi:hypothetical protein